MSVDVDQPKESSDQEALEKVFFLRNGDMIQNSLTAPEIVKQPPSPTPSDEDEDGEEEGQVTPLPGSTAELDMTWPMNDDSQHQVHMTVIPAVKDDEKRKSRYSAYHQNHKPFIPRPDNHLCLAIFAMICCCLPLGIVGFAFAFQVDKAYDDGNREGAVWRSKHAKYWSLTAVVFGMLGIIGASFYLIFFHLVPAIK